MDITRMAKMAQDFVASTSKIVGNRTINIMDTNGIIIASSDPNRVGTFHQGAYEAITTKKTVQIHSSDLPRYKGALEGCNTPIYYKGKIVGVVGMYGEPEEVTDTANLLNVYVTQFFEQNSLNLRKQTEAEVRKQLMNMFLCPFGFSKDDVMHLEDTISVHLNMPCRVYIIDFSSYTNKLKKLRQLDRLAETLLINRFIDSQNDIYGIQNDRFLILHTCSENRTSEDIYVKKLYDVCINEIGAETEIIVGTLCNDIGEIASSYSNACLLCRGIRGIYRIDEPINKEQYLIHSLSMEKGKLTAHEYYIRLLEGLGESGFANALQTLEAYYSFDCSITKAADALHIHKNTMLYRLNRIFAVTDLEHAGAFTRELLLKLVLDYYKYTINTRS